MAYEILDDSLYDKSKKNKKKTNKKKNIFEKNKGLIIHISIILTLIIILLFTFYGNLSNLFSTKKDQIILTGEIDSFNKNYSGNLSIETAQFILTTPDSKINDKSKKITIKNFNGKIIINKNNKSVILNGSASKIIFDNSRINLNGKIFTLESLKKTNTNLLFKKIKIKFTQGALEFNNSINIDFVNSTISLKNFNFSLNYDTKILLNGNAKEFSLNYPSQKIQLKYG